MFLSVWLRAVLWPTFTTFERITIGPGASLRKACVWVFLSNLFGYWIGLLVAIQASGGWDPLSQLAQHMDGSSFWQPVLEGLFIMVPAIALLAVMTLLVSTGVVQIIAHFLGATGSYTQVVYALAASLAPLTIARIIFRDSLHDANVPIALWIYGCLLAVVALKAIIILAGDRHWRWESRWPQFWPYRRR